MKTHIRNSAKALIIDKGRILLIQKKDSEGKYCLFPGGGQKLHETLEKAVKRECLEEVSAHIKVKRLAFVREYIGKNHEFADEDPNCHQVEFYFYCKLADAASIQPGSHPDSGQVGIVWAELDRLDDYRVYPKALVPLLQEFADHHPKPGLPVYLGDIN